LRSVTKQGALGSAGLHGFDRPTEGSAWIIDRAKQPDPRPLWVLVWGVIDDIAQALHDDPSIKSKLRVYFIGGPNKKWSTTAYDYIRREHPDLWIIEANSTYVGWFMGGNQAGDLGNDRFVAEHVRGHGALGDFFAGGISFKGEIRSTMKMGDMPAVVYLLGKTPDDPSGDSWGGRFVRAWDRRKYVFERAPSGADQVETYSIVEIIYRLPTRGAVGTRATLVVEQQAFIGFADQAGSWHFLFSRRRQAVGLHDSEQRSEATRRRALSLYVTHTRPTGLFAYPNWWTDDSNPAAAEGMTQGAKTVSRWREEFLRDFAERMKRCQSPARRASVVLDRHRVRDGLGQHGRAPVAPVGQS
jgi:hypothetical protein